MQRNHFLIAAATAGAAASFLRKVALAAEARPTDVVEFEALVQTILPIPSSDFPGITLAQIRGRIDELYGLSSNPKFVASLSAFSDVAGFSKGTAALFAAEAQESGDIDEGQAAARDAAAFSASGVPSGGSFALLQPEQRQRYLALWQRSALNVRRRFYDSIRALTLMAFYSLPQSWPAIGYGGPRLSRSVE